MVVTLEDQPPLSRLGRPPWSKKQLRRLGEAIRDDQPVVGAPDYTEVLLWYDDLGTAVQEAIRSLDWQSLLVDRPAPEITSRAKTIDTLRDKLRRDRATPLSNIQDIAGVRFECEMSLEEQDIVASAVASAFGHGADAVKDLRAAPHDGYRAVHLWLRLRSGRVEVQIRTHIQGAWANAYEALGDVYGRDIRYGGRPDPDTERTRRAVALLQKFSLDYAADIESTRRESAFAYVEAGRQADQDAPALSADGSPGQREVETQFVAIMSNLEAMLRDAAP